MTPRIGTLDIETFPILAYTWGLWDQNVGLNQIARDWSLMSFSYKWLDNKEVAYFDVSEQEDIYDDSFLMFLLWQFLDEADIVIAQNGVRFDFKKINARFIQLGMPPPSPYKVVDTLAEAKKVAAFTSNKLEWLSAILTEVPKDKHKDFPGFELWLGCMARDPKAWASMRKYNPRDILATEQVYLKLRPWIAGHPNLAVYNEAAEMQCPKCGGTDLQRRGLSRTQSGEYQRYQCNSCSGWSRGRCTQNSIQKRRSLLSN